MTAPLGRSRHRTGCRCCAYAETNSVLRQVEERAWRRELATFFDEHADDITEDDVSPEAAQIAADAIRRAWDAQHPDN